MITTPVRPLAPLTWSALLLAASLIGAPALAQDSSSEDATAPATDETTATAEGAEGTASEAAPEGAGTLAEEILSTGTPVGQGQGGPEIYVREEHGDWEVRCLRAPEGQDDPCQLFQRLSDQSGNPTADMNIFDLAEAQGEITAGATLLTPLQTLLTAQVTLAVDGGQPRRYPFSFCDPQGCYARLGFTAEDIGRFRRGASATIVVVPALAPDQPAQLTMSLSGFTAGFAALSGGN